jgi:hypothetical protein
VNDVYAGADLSLRRDLTSIVVVERVRVGTADRLVVRSIQTWDPKASPTKEVDFDEVRAALDRLPERFPRLKALLVDAAAESSSVLPWCRAHPRLSLVVQPFTATADTNMALWSSLVARVNAQTIAIPRHERLIAELRGLRTESFSFGSKWRVVDASRRFHRDVSFALALAVYAAGMARVCAYCDDPACTGEPPMMVMLTDAGTLSPTYREWLDRHRAPEPDEEDDDVIDVPTSADSERPSLLRTALDGPLSRARGVGQLMVNAARSAVDSIREGRAMATQALDSVLPATEEQARELARRRREKRELREMAEREAEERAEAKAAADAGTEFIRAAMRQNGGAYFPDDFRGPRGRW